MAIFDNSGIGSVIQNLQNLQTMCGKILPTDINPYNGTIVASDDSYEDETVKCSNYISNAMLEHNNIPIPCDGCPDPNNNLVENIGGGVEKQ